MENFTEIFIERFMNYDFEVETFVSYFQAYQLFVESILIDETIIEENISSAASS